MRYLLLITITLLICTNAYADSKRKVRALRITKISLFDQGDLNSPFETAIDTFRNLCPAESDDVEPEPEPFFDTLVGIEVTNRGLVDVRFNKSRFVIRNFNGQRIKSRRLNLPSIGEVSADSINEVLTFMLDVDGDFKFPFGKTEALSTERAATNVRFILFGRDFQGRRVKLRARRAIAFRDDNRCP